MPDDHPVSPSLQRPKPQRTAGVVRGRPVSPSPSAADQQADSRPPTKRARKAINCEPCRNSKLKCDRNRPCSSCVLRGTSASCYRDARGQDGSDAPPRGDDHHFARVDPAQEIARIRHSISLLESYVFPNQRNPVPQRRASDAALLAPKKEVPEPDAAEKPSTAPGLLGNQAQGGYYAGPTSAATHLLLQNENRDSEDSESRQQSQDRTTDDISTTQDYDRDLLADLPPVEVIDGLISHYFEYCNWIYRHINQSTFLQHWDRYKAGQSPDRITLATACVMMAIAVHYLPTDHALLKNLSGLDASVKFFEVSTKSLQRRMQDVGRQYSLELVECLLARAHFLTLSKTDSEEIWHVRGELVTIGMAMGLHRDPGKWRMHRDVAERRRWAWWHIILLERWQAFMFGRPISIASHHFDTQLPSYCDPALDKNGRLYLPNIALFRLAFILGDIMDDAVSVRPVPYENIEANDRALTQWMDNLPPELDLDEYRVARSLASGTIATRRLGVQSVIIRTSYYHIRFTLHRPHASNNPKLNSNGKLTTMDHVKSAQSLEIAVNAADKLITMVGQSRPDFLANSSLAVPGHMNWGPFHCFSAAMFFSFQLIANPEQPGAGLFRDKIRKAFSTLEQSKGTAVADRGLEILQALAPLYSPDFPKETPETREKHKAQVLSVVRKLAFPYHDSHDPRRSTYGDSPSARGTMSSPANSTSVSPPMAGMTPLPHQYESMQAHSSTSSSARASSSSYANVAHGHVAQGLASPQQGMQSTSGMLNATSTLTSPYPGAYVTQATASNVVQHAIYPDPRYAQYVHPVDDAMWGAAMGFGHSEWSQFLDGVRPDSQIGRHLPGP